MTLRPDSRCISPQILTPDTDHPTHDIALRPAHTGYSEDSDHPKDQNHPQQFSLLTTLIHSSDAHGAGISRPKQRSSMGFASNPSSVPSTAFSSPNGPSHGILQQAKGIEVKSSDNPASNSILRRASVSVSDSGGDNAVGLGLGGLDGLGKRLERIEEKRGAIGWEDAAPTQPRPSVLKFAVATQTQGEVEKQFSKRSYEDNDDDEDEDSDEGYREDEEDGFDPEDSADSDDGRPQFPFARPTNFNNKPRVIGSIPIPAASPPSAPALLPPPSRRGRGHVRVDETAAVTSDQDKSCSRHRSPPPTRSRSSSHDQQSASLDNQHHPSGRLSDAGPRIGRAGSPMPRKVSPDTDDEGGASSENRSEDDVEDAPIQKNKADQGGWRSDDAVFYGPSAHQVTPISASRQRRHSSALASAMQATVFVDSDEEDGLVGKRVDGVRDFIRRASEHMAGFRRPSSSMERPGPGGSEKPKPIPPNTPCAPALDNTPAMAQSLFTSDIGDASGGLTHRLEHALSSPVAASSAPQSTRSPVSVEVSRRPIVPEQGVATPIAVPQGKEEDLGWSEDALLAIRKSRGNDL
ncbi:hypothetical protein IAR55_000358 [Kwoniella newhampshirensis]|uniref:Uncharacterized protein n=1 Tax=Kwoniella newhampshirensis TaxID=1651941 RepID=A0AAW0Z703_9TREE